VLVIVPIYDFKCRACGHEFEGLVLPARTPPACPACQGQDLERLISAFAVNSEERSQAALKQARKAYQRSQRDRHVHEREDIIEHIKERKEQSEG
jgi:putative FmdB family regulatory protein